MNKITMAVIALALVGTSAKPAQAQTREEQAFLPGGIARIGCGVGTSIIRIIFGGGAADTIRDAAGSVGLCARAETPPASPNRAAATAPALQPGLQVRLVAVRPAAEGNPQVEAATPQTVYRANDGFAAVVANNAPGYLEVWSVDERSSNFVEAHVLTQATTLVLPKQVAGYYRLTTEGGSDRIRFRFHPCRVGADQAFAPQSNAIVAAAVSEQQRAVERLAPTLPVCSFRQNIDLTRGNDSLFRNGTSRAASFSGASGAYTVTSPDSSPFTTEIELRRD